MPTVPANDNPFSEGVANTPTVRPQNFNMPRVLHGPEEVASNIETGVKNIDDAYQKFQQDVNETRVLDASNKLEEARQNLKYGDSGYTHFTGENALGEKGGQTLEQFQATSLDKAYENIAKDLSTPEQKQAFRKIYLETRSRHLAAVSEWKNRQYGIYRQNVWETTTNKAYDKIASDDEAERASGFQELSAIAGRIAKESGEAEETVYRRIMGPAVALAADKMLDAGDTEGARKLLQENRSLMSQKDYQQEKAAVERQKMDETAQAAAKKVFDQTEDPAKQREELEKIKEPDVRKRALSYIQSMNTQRAQEHAYQKKQAWNAAVPYLKRGSMPPAALISELTPMERWEMENRARIEGNRLEAQARGDAERARAVVDARTAKTLFDLAATDPDTFMNTDLTRLYGRLGPKGVQIFQKIQEGIKKGMSDQFNSAWKNYQSFLTGDTGKKLTGKELERVKDEALTRWTNTWFANGGKISADEEREIIKQAHDAKTQSIFGDFIGANWSGGKVSDSAWASRMHGAPEKHQYFDDSYNAQSIKEMRAGVVINGKRWYFNDSIGRDQLYTYNIMRNGQHNYPSDWVLDAKNRIQAHNEQNPKDYRPPTRRNIEKYILAKHLIKRDLPF